MREYNFSPELVKPDSFPEKPESIKIIQTHISFIFILPNFVYKVKKPVNFGFLDFSTTVKRKFYCEEEVRLNKRLSPDVYLGVVPVVKKGEGIKFGEEGEIIDYAVKMKRLPDERILKKLIEKDEAKKEDMARISRIIADFHKKAEINDEISSYGKVESIKLNTDENFEQTEDFIGITISERTYRKIKDFTNSFLKEKIFEKRVEEGKIRDCHGDLHTEHICLSDKIYIFDCIEFNKRFRYQDTASDIAFLLMDLEYNLRPDLARAFLKSYMDFSGDRSALDVLNFYKCYRAYVRGKVEGFKLSDPFIDDKETPKKIARLYFDLAHFYTLPEKPYLIAIGGMIGTGKTTLANELGKRFEAEVISSDIVRKKLFGIKPEERVFEEFGKGIYSDDASKLTYAKMLELAGEKLKKGNWVILDASFRKNEERMKVKKLAEDSDAYFIFIECSSPLEVIKERLSKRFESQSVSDGRLEILGEIMRDYEEIKDLPYAKIDTSKDKKEVLTETFSYIWNPHGKILC